MKVFVTRVIPKEGVQLLEEAGCTVDQFALKREITREELLEGCGKADALLSAGHQLLDEDFFSRCRHLKAVALLSAGFDRVDTVAATRYGVPVGNTPGVLSNATADVALLLMLAASRLAFQRHKAIIEGKWGFFDPMAHLGWELQHKTLGILGLGRIGHCLARKCKGAFDMKVIYHNRGRNEEAEAELGAERVSFETLLAQSDVLSVHANLSPETKGLFDKAAFSRMKPGALFINTARGAMHNETDLVQALENGIIAGAGLDVTNPEPMDPHHPLLSMPQVAVLPHIGSATVETRTAMAVMAARNVVAGLRNERLPYVVNPEVY